jgi:acetyltransferase-like isoleucine patch superfamily enzyme
VPANVVLDETAYLETTYSFQLFRSRAPEAVHVGRGSSIYLGVMFDLGPEARVAVGDFTLMNGSRIICDSAIQIGAFCLISWNTLLMDTYRVPFSPSARGPRLERAAKGLPRLIEAAAPAHPVRIGNNVWIGFDSCVLPGVRIGDGVSVGARSVVARDVPPYAVVAGNPARVIRQLDPDESRRAVAQAIEQLKSATH